MTDKYTDYLIIGAGIAGASAAYELAKEASVILIERETQLAYHSTGRSAAIYMQAYGNKTVRGLTKYSLEFYTNPPKGFSDKPLLRERGAIFLATKEQKILAEQHYKEMKNDVGNLRLLEGNQLRNIVPVINTDIYTSGIFEQDAMDIDTHAVHQGYINGFKEKGGALITNCSVNSISRHNNLWSIDTTQGNIVTPMIINAAGAWADQIAGLAGVRSINLEPKKRSVFYLSIDEFNINKWPYVGDLSESFYFRPDSGKLFVSPCDEIPITPCDAKPSDLDIAIAANNLEVLTDIDVKKIDHTLAGLRSFVADRTPVVGEDTDVSGFFWLVGQGGYGFQTAPAIANCCRMLLTKKCFPDSLKNIGVLEEALSPNRISLERNSMAIGVTK